MLLILGAFALGKFSANAEEAKMNVLQTALSSTTISGYVDTSVEWTLGNAPSHPQASVNPQPKINWWCTVRLWLRMHLRW
ncbi:MAG: hypothetical protein RLY20_1474 [Verrucomicrobiota bacterium]